MKSMTIRKDFWTYVIVTIVAVLIWAWAAGETREQKALYVGLNFVPQEADRWVVRSSHTAVTLTVEGSTQALREATLARSDPIELPLGIDGVPGEAGIHVIDVVTVLGRNPLLRSTGASVLASDPPTIELAIDEIVMAPARIRERLPGVQTEGPIRFDPPDARVALPQRMRARLPDVLTVEAAVDPPRLAQLEPGRVHAIEVHLLPPESLIGDPAVHIVPPTVTMQFTIRSRIRKTQLDTVRVQLAGPPESYAEYAVELEERVLTDVTVTADADLISKIESGEATVVAILHVTNRDKENGIKLKQVSYFVAMLNDDSGDSDGVIVDAMVGDAPEPPLIHMDIRSIGE